MKGKMVLIRKKTLSIVIMLMALAGSSIAITIDVTAYGANGNDAIDDTAAIASAVAALNNGDTLLFPDASLYYSVDIDANFDFSNKDSIKIMVRGRILGDGTPQDGDYMFYFLYADDIEIIGQGSNAIIEGSGEFKYDPGYAVSPTLIRAEVCNRWTIRNVTFRRGPSNILHFRSSRDINIINCLFEGGPTEMINTNILGIVFTGLERALIKGNRFIPGADGGKAYSWICSGSTSWNRHISIIDNQFDASFDHSIYCCGLFNSVIANNVSHYSYATHIKTWGSDNVITNNTLYDTPHGAISVRNGSRCVVADNVITGFGHVAISASPYGEYSGGCTDNIISGNTIYAAATGTIYEAIRIYCQGSFSGNKIIDNVIVGAGKHNSCAAISVGQYDGLDSYELNISGNILEQCYNDGIYLKSANRSLITDNIIQVHPGKQHIRAENVTEANMLADNLLSTY